MHLPKYVVLENKRGETPLEAIKLWKSAHPQFNDIPATYAGRLDPMASGKLLVLLGEECKKRESYTGLDKEYDVDFVLDMNTDTGDALGMPSVSANETHPDPHLLTEVLRAELGTHLLPYPAFSSKTVNGKPLFQYALEGTLDTITIPEHEETIYCLLLLRKKVLSTEQLNARITDAISTVPRSNEPSKILGADFRQDDIRTEWQSVFNSIPPSRTFTVLTLRVSCSSGTYMRTLAERLGKSLDTKAFALSIRRTKIGRFVQLGPFTFWRTQY